MQERSTRWARAMVAATLVVGVATAAGAVGAEDAPGPTPLVAGDGASRPGRGHVVRQRPVEVDPAALAARGRSTVELDLFDDVVVTADVAPSTSGVDGWQAWTGTVAGDPESSVVVASDGASTSALVVTDGATYRVRIDADGDQVAQEVAPVDGEGDDAVDIPDDGAAPPAGPSSDVAPSPGDAPAEAPSAADLPAYPVVDVLVAYTPAALSQAGSLAALEAEVAQAISVSNSSFSTSGIDGRFRLAGTYAVSEDVTCSNLAQVRAAGDGYADGVHTRRDQVGADLVSVVSGAACGVAYRPTVPAHVNAVNMFSVVGYTWAVDNLTFPHELGHNLAMNHDRYQVVTGETNAGDLFPYGYGYVNVAAGWRTVMAYNTECATVPKTCTRLARFSNPDLTYGGAPTGRPISGVDPADGRAVLNQTFPLTADLRASPAPFTSWARFVQQQARDFQFGASVPAGTTTALAAMLTDGTLKPAAHVESLMRADFATSHAPVTRLYQAYYRRLPDTSGLDYWVGRFRTGLSVNKMSQYFSGTPEFRTLYGPLTNRQFVELVYQNVLGRAGEATGVAFWTSELDSGRRNRGSVMVGFSESPENKNALTHTVDAVMTYRGLLGRVPTAAERTAFTTRRAGGTTVARIILELMATTPYAARVVA